jgi:integrase
MNNAPRIWLDYRPVRIGWIADEPTLVVTKGGSPKYTGLYALRHFFASWCINRKKDGGLGLPLKVVQERLGHSTVVLTADRYSHLFPGGDDGDELAAAEKLLLA